MKRAFFSLYIIVVIGIVVIGWSIDRLYQTVNDAPAADALDSAFFFLLEKNITIDVTQDLQQQIDKITKELNLTVSLYQLEDFVDSDFKEQLLANEIVLLSPGEGEKQLYRRLGETTSVIKVQLPPADKDNNYLHESLLLVFYLGIAAVIYIWVWPLTRDLGSLERQLGIVGKEGKNQQLKMNPRSTVYHLSNEFNRMQQRIDNLLATYKEMTHAVSHELRTPLARMKFALALATSTTDPKKLEQQFESLHTDIHDMEELVSQLLSYAGFEAQSQTLHHESGDLAALVEQLFTENQRLQEAKGHMAVSYSLVNHLNGTPVFCEWHLMERVLHNLLSNAQKYAEQQILVTIGMRDGFYEIRIEDDGPGIPEVDQDRVFESFVRLPSEVTPTVKGFGLGLAIVKRILQWHKGSACIVNGKLKGACFILRWPVS